MTQTNASNKALSYTFNLNIEYYTNALDKYNEPIKAQTVARATLTRSSENGRAWYSVAIDNLSLYTSYRIESIEKKRDGVHVVYRTHTRDIKKEAVYKYDGSKSLLYQLLSALYQWLEFATQYNAYYLHLNHATSKTPRDYAMKELKQASNIQSFIPSRETERKSYLVNSSK